MDPEPQGLSSNYSGRATTGPLASLIPEARVAAATRNPGLFLTTRAWEEPRAEIKEVGWSEGLSS